MILYSLITRGVGNYYVVAINIDLAMAALNKTLDAGNFGDPKDRSITGVHLISRGVTYESGRPVFRDSDCRLILPNS